MTQASGMVSVQADCNTFDEAIALMKDRAATDGRTLAQIATAVINRSIRFVP
ncbi:MAG: hypothetical protein ACLPVY_02820 [Acidimicrobiia bacterium]